MPRLSRLRRLTSPWAEPVETAKKKKAKKRRAANPLRSRRERIKSSSGTRPRGRPPQWGGPPPPPQWGATLCHDEADGRQAWLGSRGPSTPVQARCFSLLSPHRPPTSTPYPGLPGPRYGSQGKRLITLPMGPPPPPARERDYADPLLSVSSDSDWSSIPESSATNADVWSVSSTAPTGEFYSVPADPAADQPQGSRLFRADAAPSPGFPLTAVLSGVGQDC